MSGYADALHPARARLLRRRACRSRSSPSAPGSPTSPGRCTSATPTARIVAAGRRHPGLVRRHPAGRGRQGRSSTAGGGAAWRAARSSWSSATAGSATSPRPLGEQVRRLRAVAHRVVWVNPHRGKAGYEPVQGGIVAVLPHVDDFVAGHSLAAFEELTEVVARA